MRISILWGRHSPGGDRILCKSTDVTTTPIRYIGHPLTMKHPINVIVLKWSLAMVTLYLYSSSNIASDSTSSTWKRLCWPGSRGWQLKDPLIFLFFHTKIRSKLTTPNHHHSILDLFFLFPFLSFVFRPDPTFHIRIYTVTVAAWGKKWGKRLDW